MLFFFFFYANLDRSRRPLIFNIGHRIRSFEHCASHFTFSCGRGEGGMKRGEAGRGGKGVGEAERSEGKRGGGEVGRGKYWSWEDIHACPPPALALIHHHYRLSHSSSSFSTSSFSSSIQFYLRASLLPTFLVCSFLSSDSPAFA